MPPRQAKAAVKATRPRVYARVKPNEDAGLAELFTITDTTLEYLKEDGAAKSSTQHSVPSVPLLRCGKLRVRCGGYQVRLRQGLR